MLIATQTSFLATLLASLLLGSAACATGRSDDTALSLRPITWSTDSNAPRRFVAAHGRRAAIFGYAPQGLEVWAYPVQVLSAYRVAFQRQGSSTPIDGEEVLRRVIYSPESVTRVYVGPGFTVRERLFVPLDSPGVLITYELEGAVAVDVLVHCLPVLDLMWPASIGGQEIDWDPAASAYVLGEATGRFEASVGSPDIVAHDDPVEVTFPLQRTPGVAFTMRARPGQHTVHVAIAAGLGTRKSATVAAQLLDNNVVLQRSAVQHFAELRRQAVEIETPDQDVNRALAWAEIALDQSWVCSGFLGCAEVAGYGPSRDARRPGYDWFFAEDGMVAVDALLDTGQFVKAREELEFIIAHQNQTSGRMWHELSLSTQALDWQNDPLLSRVVGAGSELLRSAARYVATSGDLAFARQHWRLFELTYRFCLTVLDRGDGLPRIPIGKVGDNEEDEARGDSLALAHGWIRGAQGYVQLAAVTAHSSESREAQRRLEQARQDQSMGELRLEVENSGSAVHVVFNPEVPDGATRPRARLGDQTIAATLGPHAQDTHALIAFDAPQGASVLDLHYQGGVALMPPMPTPIIGESSKTLRITGTSLDGLNLTVRFERISADESSFVVHTRWSIAPVQGATVDPVASGAFRVTIDPPPSSGEPGYQNGELTLHFLAAD